LTLLLISSVGLSFAYFTSSSTANSNTLSFGSLNIAINDTTGDTITLSTNSVTGAPIFASNVQVKILDNNIPAYIRAKAQYQVKSGVTQEEASARARAMCYLLNKFTNTNTYTNGSYSWTKQDTINDSYYYLVNNSGKPLASTSGINYTIFDATHTPTLVSELTSYDLGYTESEISAILNNIEYIVKFEAIQSEHITLTVNSELVSLSTIMDNVFATPATSEYGYYVVYDEQGGSNTNNVVVQRGQTVTLPYIGDNTSVAWYSGDTQVLDTNGNLAVSGSTYLPTSDITLKAVYSAGYGRITVEFDGDGATGGTLPSNTAIDYATTGTTAITVTSTIEKNGYTYTQWTDGRNNYDWTGFERTAFFRTPAAGWRLQLLHQHLRKDPQSHRHDRGLPAQFPEGIQGRPPG